MKLAAINNISLCLKYLSKDKIYNLILPTLQNTYPDGTAQFRAGAATALSEMSEYIGKDYSSSKIVPILSELLKDENSEVKLNVVKGIEKIAVIVGMNVIQSIFRA